MKMKYLQIKNSKKKKLSFNFFFLGINETIIIKIK